MSDPIRYYTTASPGASSMRTYESLEEAIEAAAKECASKKETRYVVAIVAKAKLEPPTPPVKVTRYE